MEGNRRHQLMDTCEATPPKKHTSGADLNNLPVKQVFVAIPILLCVHGSDPNDR